MNLTDREIQSLTAGKRAAEADLKAARDMVRRLELQISQKDERIAQKDERIESLLISLQEMTRSRDQLLEEVAANVRQMTDFILGKGPVTISGELRKAVEDGIRAEYEDTIKALKEEIKRLRSGGGGNSSDGDNGNIQDALTKIRSAELQNADLRNNLYGSRSESSSRPQFSAPVPADELDMDGIETPEIEIAEDDAIAAAAILLANSSCGRPGPKGKHPQHPASKYAETLIIEPDDLPEGAKPLMVEENEYVSIKIYWIDGHVRIVKNKRPKYYKDGRHYQAPAPKFLLGNMQIDINFLVQILDMFIAQKVTLGTVEQWIADQGLSFDHSTVVGWIRKAADILEPIDGPIHDAIMAEERNHVDETTIRVCDTPLNIAVAQSEDLGLEITEEEKEVLAASKGKHFFVRWLYAFFAPSIGLVQYKFHNRGSRKGDAVDEFYEGLDHRIYLNTDGAKMYDKYADGLGNLVKIGCGVHMRRPFYKLKDVWDEAFDMVELWDRFFNKISEIKRQDHDIGIRKKRQLLEALPIMMEIQKRLDYLKKFLDPATEPELVKAVNYSLKELPTLMRAFERGDIEFSNNLCEQQIRRIAIYRNNSQHCGSVESTIGWARLQSISQSCKNNGKNFKRYVKDLIIAILTTPKQSLREKLDAMLPHKWVDPMPFAIPEAKLMAQ